MNGLRAWTLTLTVTLAAIAAACAPAAMAAAPGGEAAHSHSHEAAAPAKLHLNHGRKWGTDAPLREGMVRIRGIVAPGLPAAHAGKMSAEDYAALASRVQVEVGNIVANCKLPPEADAVLHVIVADLLAGSDTMAGRTAGTAREQGLVQVATAVNQYGRYFDHRGFQPLKTGH